MKKIISVFICILILFSCTGLSMITASAASPAEKAQPFFYFETGVDTLYVYFYIEEAKGISSGHFTLEYDSSVFDCSGIQQVYEDGSYYYIAEAYANGEIYCSFSFNGGTCPVNKLEVCVMQFDIIGEVHDVSYAEMSVSIDDIAFSFEPYPIEIINLYYGDVDFNQKVTAADARLVLRASVGLEYLTETQTMLGDIDESGTITAADARLILRASVGLDDEESESSQNSYMSFYDDLIRDLKWFAENRQENGFDENWDELDLSDTFMNMENRVELSYELNCMATENFYWEKVSAADFGYILYDLDSDGIPELFWVNNNHTILAIFTCKNNKVALLDAFWSRYTAFIDENGKLYTHGSGGFADHRLCVCKLKGTNLEAEYMLESSLNYDSTIDYYEYKNDTQIRISESEFYRLLKAYPSAISSSWKAQTIKPLV